MNNEEAVAKLVQDEEYLMGFSGGIKAEGRFLGHIMLDGAPHLLFRGFKYVSNNFSTIEDVKVMPSVTLQHAILMQTAPADFEANWGREALCFWFQLIELGEKRVEEYLLAIKDEHHRGAMREKLAALGSTASDLRTLKSAFAKTDLWNCVSSKDF